MKKLRWLVRVRQELLNINFKGYKDGTPCRKRLFNAGLKLDHKAWLTYYEDGYTPLQAVREDLGLPIIEYKKHTLIF